eukprot:Hpha_TRINITY_DN23814_c0_g1::TRINITY_DN23814_c0_g1_i1::g.109859::m.109859
MAEPEPVAERGPRRQGSATARVRWLGLAKKHGSGHFGGKKDSGSRIFAAFEAAVVRNGGKELLRRDSQLKTSWGRVISSAVRRTSLGMNPEATPEVSQLPRLDSDRVVTVSLASQIDFSSPPAVKALSARQLSALPSSNDLMATPQEESGKRLLTLARKAAMTEAANRRGSGRRVSQMVRDGIGGGEGSAHKLADLVKEVSQREAEHRALHSHILAKKDEELLMVLRREQKKTEAQRARILALEEALAELQVRHAAAEVAAKEVRPKVVIAGLQKQERTTDEETGLPYDECIKRLRQRCSAMEDRAKFLQRRLEADENWRRVESEVKRKISELEDLRGRVRELGETRAEIRNLIKNTILQDLPKYIQQQIFTHLPPFL